MESGFKWKRKRRLTRSRPISEYVTYAASEWLGRGGGLAGQCENPDDDRADVNAAGRQDPDPPSYFGLR